MTWVLIFLTQGVELLPGEVWQVSKLNSQYFRSYLRKTTRGPFGPPSGARVAGGWGGGGIASCPSWPVPPKKLTAGISSAPSGSSHKRPPGIHIDIIHSDIHIVACGQPMHCIVLDSMAKVLVIWWHFSAMSPDKRQPAESRRCTAELSSDQVRLLYICVCHGGFN